MSIDEARPQSPTFSDINDRDAFLEGTDHLFRLFVGWVPKSYTEAELKPVFEQCGAVKDLIVLKDKVSNQPRGCAFVSFATKEEAELAISKLDRKLHLPGALSPLEVRFARSHQYIQAGAGPQDNRQLFFSRAPVNASEEDLRNLFGRFGEVHKVSLFRERQSQSSKGCGFVVMGSRETALAALEGLDETTPLEGNTPLSVKWADPELQGKKKKAVEDSNADNRMLFFAKVLRSSTEEEVKALFSKYGRVYAVNLFRAFQGAPTSKGCGLVTMGSHEEAQAAIDGLDNKLTWEGMDSPMVVKWMDAALQKRRREEHLAAMRQGLVPSMALGPLMGSALKRQDASEQPPPGCAPDAIKLFVGNVPKSYSEEQLRPFFESMGRVVELVVVRDKVTHESKGSAFVWYATRAYAERALQQLNVRHVLPDPAGEHERPLVVRQANARSKPAPVMLGLQAGMQAQPYSDSLHTGMVDLPAHLQATGGQSANYYPAGVPGRHVGSLGLGLEGLSLSDSQHRAPHMMQPVMGLAPSLQGPGSMEPYVSAAAPLGGPMANPMAVLGPGPLAGPLAGPVPAPLPGPVASGAPAHMDNMMQLSLSIPLTAAQINVVNNHMYSIQTMCGAQLRTAPGAPGLFYLIISGTENQVEAAKALVMAVLNQSY